MIQTAVRQIARKQGAIGRRGFLRMLTAGSIASVTPFPIVETAVGETARDRRKPLYRESKDVKAFYRANRYP